MLIIKLVILSLIFCFPIYSQDFFPLEIGNVWHYEVSSWYSAQKDTFSIRVTGDTLMPNGINYYVLNESLSPGDFLTPYVRVDTAFIFFYDFTDSTDTPVYDFNAVLDEYYRIGLYAVESDSPRVQLMHIDTTQVFGDNSETIHFHTDCLVPFDLTFSKKYGPLGWYSAHHEPIWSTLIGCTISGIDYGFVVGLEKVSQHLIDFSLEQNYPNPFNSSTIIRYSLHKQSRVEIKLFNTAGKLVRILEEEVRAAGTHGLEFDGNNLASGIYFYQMKVGKFVETRKLVMLK